MTDPDDLECLVDDWRTIHGLLVEHNFRTLDYFTNDNFLSLTAAVLLLGYEVWRAGADGPSYQATATARSHAARK